MSQHTLYIEMNPAPEVLERVLRVTRHRGFTVCHMHMSSMDRKANIAVTVDSDRPIEHLTRQLDKLYDVKNCRLEISQARLANG
ncbi:acetolactate synthase 2 small subunit [Ferrimonas sediminicola]|uniref:Acetolactate synthase 2 small subunit n=1 Tax=Ferrimonas sediminicola TaxID=2569538 RepID=A0A4U1BHW3_9GAMM|nr:acetolactate synthase 2 small subunit [Ferrimonas sediminicola]TKB51036.1 acetolactate synthase 2 small subunit [Ferrimonas sediminicola]